MMHGATSSRTRRCTARHHRQRPEGVRRSTVRHRRQTRGATKVASSGAVPVRPVTADLPAEDFEQVAAVIARLCNSRAWIGICHASGPLAYQCRRAVVWARHSFLGALGALGVEGSDIPQHPPEGASP